MNEVGYEQPIMNEVGYEQPISHQPQSARQGQHQAPSEIVYVDLNDKPVAAAQPDHSSASPENKKKEMFGNKKVSLLVVCVLLISLVYTTCFNVLYQKKENPDALQKENQTLETEKLELKSEINKINNTFQKQLTELKAEFNKMQLDTELQITDCKEAMKQKAIERNVLNKSGGVFDISRSGKFYEVYCDTTTDGGGWTVFQRRMDGSVDFYRTWEEYADGFGNKTGEFWLGLENIYQLTLDGDYELRVDLTDWEGRTGFARYGTFSISGRSDNYTLTIGDYAGTAGDSMRSSNGQAFLAKDSDFDTYIANCAQERFGAWWYFHRGCSLSCLNGRYNDTSAGYRGVLWYHWKNTSKYSLKASEMKFRKK